MTLRIVTTADRLLEASEALQDTARRAQNALSRHDYWAFSHAQNEALQRFGALHAAYRAFITRTTYRP
jgi:predicted metal-dependent hydrolase